MQSAYKPVTRSVCGAASMADSGLYAACVGALLACVAGADTGAADSSAPNAAATTADTQAHAFDFLMGTWNVQNTLLTSGCNNHTSG